MNFSYSALPMRVVFGAGSIGKVAGETSSLGLEKILVLCGPRQEAVGKQVADALGDRCAGLLPEATMHVPAEVAAKARATAAELGADGCVAVGGGSAIGLGKAVALELGLPVVAVPTTYAGSEMTPVWGLTENGIKRTGRDPKVLPVSVVYDPALTMSMPVGLAVTSGINAIAHAAEGLYAPDASPVVSLMAREGIRALTTALPAITERPDDGDARADALYGAWLCGAVLGATTMGLHHKLCHALGGTLNLPHSETHTVVLPHVLAYNDAHEPDGLWELEGRLGAPRSLRELGMAEGDIDRIAEQVASATFANPRPVTRDGVRDLLRVAWAGTQPER